MNSDLTQLYICLKHFIYIYTCLVEKLKCPKISHRNRCLGSFADFTERTFRSEDRLASEDRAARLRKAGNSGSLAKRCGWLARRLIDLPKS